MKEFKLDKYTIVTSEREIGEEMRYSVLITNNKAVKHPIVCNYYFRTEEKRNTWVMNWVTEKRNSIDNSKTIKRERIERNQAAIGKAKVGDILYSMWGYEQTNVDFYQVTKIKGQMIVVREIESKKTLTTDMTGDTMPVRNVFIGEELTKRIQADGEGYCVSITSYANAYKWDGKAKHFTAYA